MHNLVAGMTVGSVIIPQGFAYGKYYSWYACFVIGFFAFVTLGSSDRSYPRFMDPPL